jgi:hypothetical protein
MPVDPAALVGFARAEDGREAASVAAEQEGDCLSRALAGSRTCVVTVGPGSVLDRVWRRLVSGGW